MKKNLFTAITICAICAMYSPVIAQNTGFKKSIRLSYGYVGGEMTVRTPSSYPINKENYIIAARSSNLLYAEAYLWSIDHFGLGGYLGVGEGCYSDTDPLTTWNEAVNIPSFHYGVSITAHMLSLASIETNRWDVEMKGSIGTFIQQYITPQMEYNIGVCIQFYPFDHWGLFVENIWGKFVFVESPIDIVNNGNTMMKVGLSYRF